MDSLTWLSLGLQLAALCSIVAALLLYLFRKVRGGGVSAPDSQKTILVTSVDTALGLQIATYMSSKGWRVIAGCRSNSLGGRLAGNWATTHENARLTTIELDVLREDKMMEGARAVVQHLPSGEKGVHAVINTWGECWCQQRAEPARGEERALRGAGGALRVIRILKPIVARPLGRMAFIGVCDSSGCGSACRAGRSAVEGAALHSAVVLRATRISPSRLFAEPKEIGTRPTTPMSTISSSSDASECTVAIGSDCVAEYTANVLNSGALKTIEEMLVSHTPKKIYDLSSRRDSWFSKFPLKVIKPTRTVTVQVCE